MHLCKLCVGILGGLLIEPSGFGDVDHVFDIMKMASTLDVIQRTSVFLYAAAHPLPATHLAASVPVRFGDLVWGARIFRPVIAIIPVNTWEHMAFAGRSGCIPACVDHVQPHKY
jgi:hypothetical protein